MDKPGEPSLQHFETERRIAERSGHVNIVAGPGAAAKDHPANGHLADGRQ